MNREQLLEQFIKNNQHEIERARNEFSESLPEHINKLSERVIQSFYEIARQFDNSGKDHLMYFYFSLLKIDTLKREYNVLLEAQDNQWYLDQTALQTTFSIDFLFEPLNRLWDYLDLAVLKYIGKVNAYDVRKIIFMELDQYNSAIAHLVRYLVKQMESDSRIQNMVFPPCWTIRWGTYRDDAELVKVVDRYEKGPDDWKTELKKAKSVADHLVYAYWFLQDIKGAICEEENFLFATFEQCQVGGSKFHKCNFCNSSWKQCKFQDCDFAGSLLQDADFSGCQFEQVSFHGADLSNCIFEAEVLPGLGLDPEQLQSILVRREEEQ